MPHRDDPEVPRLGDPALRPEEDFVVVPATPEMQAEAAILSSNCAVAWLDGARQDIPCQQVAAELATELGARLADVEVVKHYPEQFFVRFVYQHHCADAMSRGHLRGAGHRIYVREWRLEAHADNEDQLHHVRLCLEGVPLHGWNNYIATFLIGRGCSLDYIEQRSLRKEDTRDLALWAWTANPNAIPKVKWLTLPARGHRRRGRRGLRHRVLIHLDLHEDHSKAGDDNDNPPPPDVHEFTWYRKVVDGTYVPREGRPAQGCTERRADRREDDGDRDGRRGRDGGRPREGWGARVRRSLSRNPRERQREGGQDRTRDRSGGRRHDSTNAAVVATPLACAAILRGSGPGSDEPVRALELLDAHEPVLVDARGRSPLRQASPRASRRRSLEERTPPASPPLSPTTVLPPSPISKRAEARSSPLTLVATSHAMSELCSPTTLARPLVSPSRPPGFQSSPTPPLACVGPLRRTPSHVRAGAAGVSTDALASIFMERQMGVLATPESPPPRPPAARRKTLAGVKISTRGGLTLQKVKWTDTPAMAMASKAAEKLVCRTMGITKNGEDMTEAILDEFTAKFKEQLAPEVILAMREFFHLDDSAVIDVEDALIDHGGAGALELAQDGAAAQDNQGSQPPAA
ncbi:hypothetical protein VPH35_001041 [Triticum aestivum]